MRPVVVLLVAFGSTATAQAPPQPLPGTITGTPVVPAAATAPAAKSAPFARFQNLNAFPPETVQAVYGMRTGAEWLARMQQPHGRFLRGLNPAVKLPLDGEDDFQQALTALAVCQAAKFTRDEKLTAVAGQAVLALLTSTKDDPTGHAGKVPVPSDGCCKVGFAAALALACFELPGADAKVMGEGQKLCAYLRSQCQPDGSVAAASALSPGFALQAMAASHRASPDSATKAVLVRGLAFYRAAFRSKPDPVLAGTVIPAAVDFYLQSPDRDAAATALEMADWLCASQYGKGDVRQVLWAGGFRAAGAAAEPGYDSAFAARGLAAAIHLTRQLPDAARYAKYRPALVEALGFVHGLQYTPDNTDHFEGKFRAHYLIGGVRLAPADGTVRIDATAAAVSAYLRYLESGAETRE